ncbi:transcription factor IIIB 50 kDa subunit isoform X2 [Falco biarmicus]|uniref:transcription factor IIIB 50 kDa subunit isoform X2 n=1 Tax=Falco rusticolus TaxID=120794 RepID=UPI001886A54E|nr:transcription factor IIIB 50 kDa subunit isoform X2 [Falco rusticolus]XP_055552169.1 transcription factor IIIB 50 kDa subunit isoform X2 [Falco cherrug]XP_055676058.1 transcription factor IIIB 50 kDa subunit isoform X2 [Falco peregrinus]XP_056219071.1 transcription factor IIIB 50 kDa subunit isoform X2 [Falco biarmicus]
MAARGSCPACGSAALVEDAHYAQQQLVCAACGCVLAEGLLTTTYTEEEHLREVAYSQSTGQKEQLSRCLQRGIKRVQDLCKVLQLPTVFEETAVSYFQRALQHPSFHLELFASVYLSLQKELGLSVPALSLADLVKTHLNSFRLFQHATDIPAPFVEDKETMVTRTMQIVELASETWLVTGRHPVPIVMAAAFLSWQSLQPAARLACTFARFCKLAGVDLPPPAHLRLKELLDILLRMASQLAWLRMFNMDKKTVVKHIGDLLQHRIFLLKNAFSLEDEEQHASDPGKGSLGEGSLGKGTAGSPAAAGGAVQEEGCPLERKRQCEGSPRPLLPPCLINPRKRLRTAALSASDSAITGDEPISDSEIEQYLRGPEEIRAFRKAKAWL